MKINSGIYKFTNNINGKVYIGQSKYLKTRYREHKSDLLNGKHHNDYFQKSVNKYGFDNFKYEVILLCDVEELDFWEDFYIKKYNSTNRNFGYNIKDAGNESNLPQYVIEKMSKSHLGKNNKLTEKQVEEIKEKRLQGLNMKELAEMYNVDKTTINKITTCKNWKQVREDLNEKLVEYNRSRKTKAKKQTEEKIIIPEKEIKDMFVNGSSIDEITRKFNITYSQYKRITKNLVKERDKHRYDEICRLKNENIMIKDIAKILGINRCTVNEIIKRFSYAR